MLWNFGFLKNEKDEKQKMTDFLEGKIKKLQTVEERRKNQI
jgi:hypothetical protein